MTTFKVSYGEFRKQAAIFLKTCQSEDLTVEQVEAGMKCVTLHYLGIGESMTERQTEEAVMILEMCEKKVLDAQFREVMEEVA